MIQEHLTRDRICIPTQIGVKCKNGTVMDGHDLEGS